MFLRNPRELRKWFLRAESQQRSPVSLVVTLRPQNEGVVEDSDHGL